MIYEAKGPLNAAYQADSRRRPRSTRPGNRRSSPTRDELCGESCTWYEESLERSIEGQIVNGTSSLVHGACTYDKAGRLTEAQETPTGGQCTTTTRAYTFDADSNPA